MMDTPSFDYKEARSYCMNYGLLVGLCWSASFVCAMWGQRHPFVGNLGLLIGLLSIYYAGRLIRGYNRESGNSAWLRTWWMSFLTYIFATLLTAVVQYIYFRFIDNGMLLQQTEEVMHLPQYEQLFEGFDEKAVQQALSTFTSPTQLTFRFFSLNILLGLVLSIPTMLIGNTKLKKETN